jgi:nicotinamide-nucleotide amidase
MTAAVLCIGTELTRGELVNTNAPWLATRLTELGFEVVAIDTVDDDRDRIVDALERLSKRARVVLCTGGLGPTTDDITTECVAKVMGAQLVRHEPSLEAIRRRFEKLGREMSPSNAKQADFPEGADVLPNSAGTAPGFAVFLGEARAFFTPGVPRELERLWDEQIAPRLRPIARSTSFQIRLRTFGMPESMVGEKLAGLEAAHAGLTLGYRATYPEIEVKVLVRDETQELARQRAHAIADDVRTRLGSIVYGDGEDTFPEVVGRCMRARGYRLALAESCTGGLVGSLLTSCPASEFFVADAVTYANSAKSTLLGVDEDVLRAHGAVSSDVAQAMAEGVKRACSVDIALAITGIAGPTGGTPEKPVGLVYWAVAHPKGTVVRSRVLSGDRSQIQRMAAFVGMAFLREVCLDDERQSAVLRAAAPA